MSTPTTSVATVPARGPIERVTTRILGEPTALRDLDLLSVDQPLKPYPPIKRWRYNAGLRALFFFAVFAVTGLLGGALVGVAMGVIGWDQQQMMALLEDYSSILGIIAAVFAYWPLGRVLEQRRPVHELAPHRAVRGVLVGLAMGALIMVICAALLAAVV